MDVAKLKHSITTIDMSKIIDIVRDIDVRSFLIGLSVVIGLYGSIYIYTTLNSTKTLHAIESQLASETIEITKKEPMASTHTAPQTSEDTLVTLDGLYEKTMNGKLPIIRHSDNLTSFRAYQAPFSFENIGDKPVLSFVIVDYGLSKQQSELALDLLPPEVSFLLSPYTTLPQEWMKLAQNKGHEVWLNLPIQNKHSNDLGINTIYHHNNFNEKQMAMHASMVQTLGYIGVGSFTDDSINVAKDHYTALSDEIYKRGLGYLELNPEAPPTLASKALGNGAPYLIADIEVFKIKGENSFDALESLANKNGYALAVIPNYPDTIKNLAVWILKVAQADYVIAPVSALYDLPMHRTSMPGATNLNPNDHIEPEQDILPAHH